MKKYEVLKNILSKIRSEANIEPKPNTAYSVGLYSIYDLERDIYNPPFSSDDISAIHVFVKACLENPEFEITLCKVADFKTSHCAIFENVTTSVEPGTFLVADVWQIDASQIRAWIDELGGIEE